MSKQDRTQQLMDYLYDEMPAAERPAFEEWLDRHPEALEELEALRRTREFLGQSAEVLPAPLLIEMPNNNRRSMPRWWARAAAVALLLVAAWLLDFRVHAGEQGLTLGFGSPPPPTTPAADTYTAEAAPDQPAELTVLDQQMDQKLQALDSLWNDRFTNLQQQQQKQWTRLQQQHQVQLAGLQKDFAEAEWPRLATLMQQLQLEQQDELRLLIAELWDSWQQTRKADLQAIDSRMTSLYQNVERNQLEAEARFVNYLQNIGDK